ncbi:MAG: electron transfer flavoprotein beta subunit/FixA family protein [Peptococcaceae bacterium]|nr:electron transfer flavoprotein beta subunit/FixA family protein [Peptococcaceae bacterium]
MPRILVCYKWVLDEQDIKIVSLGLSLDVSRAKYKISDYDKNAIEEAVRIVEKNGGSVEAISFGTSLKQSFKDVLSRGVDKVYAIDSSIAENADAYVTANVLAAAIRKIGPYDLILCADGSSDVYNQQIGSRLSALLGLPGITSVSQINCEGDRISATRKLGDCTEVVHIKGQAVISVLPEINSVRIPTMKQVLAAAKKPSEEIKIDALGLSDAELLPKVTKVSVKGFVMNRKNIVFKDANQKDNVSKLVASLAKEGLLKERG